MKTFIDTNVFLRYFDKLPSAVEFMSSLETEKSNYYIPSVVMNEISWMLLNNYRIGKLESVRFIEGVLAVSQFKLVYDYDYPNALNQYKKVNVKLTDCMIWSYMEPGDRIVSFDKDFDKLPEITRIEPKSQMKK